MSLYALYSTTDFSLLPFLQFGWEGDVFHFETGWLNVGVGVEW